MHNFNSFNLQSVKNHSKIATRVLLIVFLGISFLSSCSTLQLTERGTASNWPGKSTTKKQSKLAIVNASKLNDEKAVVSSNFILSEPVTQSSTRNLVDAELPSPETIKLEKINAPNHNDSRLSFSKHLKLLTPFQSKLISGKEKTFESPIGKPEFMGQRMSKHEVVPDSGSDIGKWLLYILGLGLLISIGGYGLLMGLFAIGWGESIALGVTIFLISLIPGLFYLWASHLYDGLEDHSVLYQVGFWGTIAILPAIFALPIWIFAAIRDAVNNGSFDPILKSISNAFAWLILILGEFVALLTAFYYVLYSL